MRQQRNKRCFFILIYFLVVDVAAWSSVACAPLVVILMLVCAPFASLKLRLVVLLFLLRVASFLWLVIWLQRYKFTLNAVAFRH